MIEALILISFILLYWKMITIEQKIDNISKERPVKSEEVIKEIEETKVVKESVIIPPTPIIKIPKKIEDTKLKDDVSLEEWLFANILVKVSVVAFILGVGLFLKYSIDKNWIPIWGRSVIGVIFGIAMIVGGRRFIDNTNKLFSQGLFGGGIAILYLSIYAGFAFDEFKFLSFNYAFVFMVMITILAGFISVKFDAKSTAILGLIGGFMTPFFINRGIDDTVGLLTYMLVLNIGVLYISIFKKWSILAWMAFVITALTQLISTTENDNSFVIMTLLYSIFFIIYSIVPFINNIREDKKSISMPFLYLFSLNSLVALGSFYLILEEYDMDDKLFAIVTLSMASYLLIYAGVLARKKVLLTNLYYIVLAQAIALILYTPAIVFSDMALTVVWSVESFMLIWIADKSDEKIYAKFAIVGFILTMGSYIFIDLGENIQLSSYYTMFANRDVILLQLKILSITSFFVITSLFGASLIFYRSKLEIPSETKSIIFSFLIIVLFIYLNITTYELVYLAYPDASKFSITILWLIFGISMFVIGVLKDLAISKFVATVVILLAILKAFVSDLARFDALYKIVLFMILGVLLFGVSYFYQMKSEKK